MGYPWYIYHLWQEFKVSKPSGFIGYLGKEKIHCKKIREYLREHPNVGAITENKTAGAWGGYCLRAFRNKGIEYEVEMVSGKVIEINSGQEYECLRELFQPDSGSAQLTLK